MGAEETHAKPAILVMGKIYLTPLGVMRSLGKAGYDVEMLYIPRRTEDPKILGACRYCKRLVVADNDSDECLLDALLHSFDTEGKRYLLFPTDDISVSMIDRYRDQLAPHFLMAHAKAGTITEMMDKSVQGAIAREVGFRVARSWVISLEDDPLLIPEDVPYPCLMKPLISANGGKYGIQKCMSREELLKGLQKVKAKRPHSSIMVQEFLDIQCEYTIGGVSEGETIYIPAVIRKTCIARHNRGVTLQGKLVENGELAPVMPLVEAYLRRVGFVGMFDLEVLKTSQGFYFGEMNLRCGGPSYAYFHAGVNLPDLAVKAICGEPWMPEKTDICLGELFVNNKVAWEDYAYRQVSGGTFRKWFRECAYTLLDDEEDPEPVRLFDRLMAPLYREMRFKEAVKNVLAGLHLYHK